MKLKNTISMLVAASLIIEPSLTIFASDFGASSDSTLDAITTPCVKEFDLDALGVKSEHDYAVYTDTTHVISAPGATRIEFTFHPETELDDDGDHITISVEGEELETYTKNELQKDASSGVTLSYDTDEVTIHFTSDGSDNKWGYELISAYAYFDEHSGTTVDEVPNSCEADGYRIINCDNCGRSNLKYILPATGHDYVNQVGTHIDATYETSGHTHQICSNCLNEIDEDTEMLSLDAPILSVSLNEPVGIKLTWNDLSEQAEGYQIFRNDKGDSPLVTLLNTEEEQYTSYQDLSALPGKTYTYKVRAVRVNEFSEAINYTDSVEKTIVNTALVKTTAKLTSIAKGVSLSWTKVPRATGYDIEYSLKSNASFKLLNKTAITACSFKQTTGLTYGYTYYFRVHPYQMVEGIKRYGAYSAVVSSRITSLATPKLTTAINVSQNSITLKWGKIAGAKGYYVYRKTSTGKYALLATIKSGSTVSYVDKKATTLYVYKVVAYVSAKDYSFDSNQVYARVLKSADVKIKKSTGYSYKISWPKVTGASKYELYYKENSGAWKLLISTTALSYTHKIKHCTKYSWKVRPIYTKSGATSYAAFGKASTPVILYCKFANANYTVTLSKTENYKCTLITVKITNKGSHNITISNKNATYSDYDYYAYDRKLSLVNASKKAITKLVIKPKATATVYFKVVKTATHYDKFGTVSFVFNYGARNWKCEAIAYNAKTKKAYRKTTKL